MRCLILIAAAALLAPVPAAQGSLITISNSSVGSEVGDSSNSIYEYLDSTDVVPTDTNITLSSNSDTSSLTSLSFLNSDTQSIIDFDYEHSRGGALGLYAGSYAGITFTPTSDAVFTLSGNYTLAGDNQVQYVVHLTDGGKVKGTPGSLPVNVLHNFLSFNTPGEVFTLGDTDFGDSPKKPAVKGGGSPLLTGYLTAGRNYSFSFSAYIASYNPDLEFAGDDGATAAGYLTLTIDQVTSTPEPASFALLGLASLCGVGLRFRRRSASSNAA